MLLLLMVIVRVMVVLRVVVLLLVPLLGRGGGGSGRAVVHGAAGRRRLDLAAEPVGLAIVQHGDRVEPAIEERIVAEVVGVGGALEQPDPGEHLELLAALVEVDEAVGYRVRDRRVDHRQVREEGAQVRDRPVTYVLRGKNNTLDGWMILEDEQ